MEEKIELKDFDILGIITLKDIAGIEKYVTPIVEQEGEVKEYLSRSKEYYNVKSMAELSNEREELKRIMTRQLSKRNFVVLENMLNCSAKVYFKKFEEYIKSNKNQKIKEQMEQAQECLIEDVKNVIVVLSGKGLIKISEGNILPKGIENSERRAIEMDNKAIYGYDYTNMLKSKYIEDTLQTEVKDIASILSSTRILEKDKITMLIDDNIGTGTTMSEITQMLKDEGINKIISGAEYVKYLKTKSYRQEEYPDLEAALDRGIFYARNVGVEMAEGREVPNRTIEGTKVIDKYKDKDTIIEKDASVQIIEKITENTDKYCFEKENDKDRVS